MPLDSARHYWWARNCYYEGSPRRPRRWNKAVASHSPDSSPNPNAFSRHIRNEAAMHHAERKAFVLPCRYTLAQSWAALRKAWLAFKIANANGDIQTMRDYARIIRTLQIQMGIRGTIFEDYIFDEEDERDLLVEVSRLEMPWKKQGQIALDRSPDYEAFRNNNTLDKPIQGPRNEIFVSHHAKVVEYKTSANSCPVPPDTRPKVVEYKTSANSCPVPEYYGRAGTQEHNEGVIKENIENNEFQYYVDTSDIDDRSPDEDRLLDKDDVYPENQFISQVPDCTIHKDKGCSYQSSDYTVLYDENEKDIKRKPRACPYNPKGINQDD
jgi:hypothetical protein